MLKTDVQWDVPDRDDRSDQTVAAEPIEDAAGERPRPVAVPAPKRRPAETNRGLEDADDWRWVRG